MTARVGIVANPAAAHDLRRISGYSSVVDSQEKVRVVRRILLGLQAAGVNEVLFMPDHHQICANAADINAVTLTTRALAMDYVSDATDSTEAARLMREESCACIITLGGDGTNRAVAKGCGTTPILALSTGTNNVVPRHVEGTIAGLAAGYYASGRIDEAQAVSRTKRLEISSRDTISDIALVDAAVSLVPFIGARAITNLDTLERMWFTQAEPGCIGLAAIGAALHPFSPEEDGMLEVILAPDGSSKPATELVDLPIAPGVITTARVTSWRVVPMDERVRISSPCTLAFDGERTLRINQDDRITIAATWNGPRLLDATAIMRAAADMGFFKRQAEVAPQT